MISVVACSQNDTTMLYRIVSDIGTMLTDVKTNFYRLEKMEENVKNMDTVCKGNKEHIEKLEERLKDRLENFEEKMEKIVRLIKEGGK